MRSQAEPPFYRAASSPAADRRLVFAHPGQAANTAVVKAGRLLFLLNDDAELIVARASRSAFEPITRYVVADSATWAQPAISGNRIYGVVKVRGFRFPQDD